MKMCCFFRPLWFFFFFWKVLYMVRRSYYFFSGIEGRCIVNHESHIFIFQLKCSKNIFICLQLNKQNYWFLNELHEPVPKFSIHYLTERLVHRAQTDICFFPSHSAWVFLKSQCTFLKCHCTFTRQWTS